MRTLVIGDTLEGLLTAWVFARHPGMQVVLIASGQRYRPDFRDHVFTEHHGPFTRTLRRLDVPFSSYTPQIGVMWKKGIVSARSINPSTLVHAQTAKELGVPIKVRSRTNRDRWEVRFSQNTLRKALEVAIGRGHILRPTDWKLEPGALWLDQVGRQRIDYDFCVVADSLHDISRKIWFQPTQVSHTRRNVWAVHNNGLKELNAWDRIMVPPVKLAMSMIRWHEGVIVTETSINTSAERLLSDLQDVVTGVVDVELSGQIERATSSHQKLSTWPENIACMHHTGIPVPTNYDQTLNRAYNYLTHWT